MKIKHLLTNRILLILLSFILFAFKADVGNVLINFNFQSALPTEVTSNGTLLPTKAADGVCSKGIVQVNTGQFMQVDISSCSVFNLNMKSTSASARTVTIRYKKFGDANFTDCKPTLTVQTAAAFNIATLYPEIITSGPVSIRVETVGNIQIHDLYVEGNSTLSTAAEITGFKIPDQLGSETINTTDKTISISVPAGTSLTSVVPASVVFSSLATISPLATVPQDFSSGNEVAYTVTAQDGTTTKIWKVKVTEVASSAKEITAFKLSNDQIGSAVINSAAGTIDVIMPAGADLTNLVPVTLSISSNATINPAAGDAQNFTDPVSYTVKAQDNSTKVWIITTTESDPNAIYASYQSEDAEFTGKTDNQHANYTGTGYVDFLASGENFIIFTVCQKQASTQNAAFHYSLAKDDVRKGKLYVNDAFIKLLNFPRTATFDEWKDELAVVSLQAGLNQIKITWDTTDGPNLDKLSLTGEGCNAYSLSVSATNSGVVTIAPKRTDMKYYEGETVTLLGETKANTIFQNWSGDVSGTTNPIQVVMNSNKTVTGNFNAISTFKLNITKVGIGDVQLSPAGGEYTAGTVVTLTAKSVLGSVFQGWGGSLTGSNTVATVTMDGNKNVTASFTSDYHIDFNKVVGFASVVTSTYSNFNGPTIGGMNSADTLWIHGPAEFDKMAVLLYDRIKAYKNKAANLSAKYAPLTIILKEGVYTGTGTSATTFANSMLTIQEQGDLTIMGEKNVVLKFGINVKRSWNLLIRNITFQDYYDDGINIGDPLTHHIWVDHCTVGNPTAMPPDSEHPDGGIDIKEGASYVTISWCHYRNSWKTGLVGHSDNNGPEDTGKLKVTYFSNYFYHTNSRNPRVRFGQVHVLNNLGEQIMLYGIAASNNSQVYAENNFYLNTDWPMYADRASTDFKAVYGNNTDDVYTSKTGNYPCTGLKQVGNEYDDTGLPIITAQLNPAMLNPGGRSVKFDEFNAAAVFNPHDYYSYEPLPASAIRSIIPMFAGVDKVDFALKPATPTVTVAGTLLPFSQRVGTPSPVQTYSVSGNALTDNISITPAANYEVSADAGAHWFTSVAPLTLPQTSGMVPITSIQVRLNASGNGTYSGTIMNASTGAANASIAVSGNAVSSVNTATGTLTNFLQTIGAASPVHTYVVAGTNLVGNITITPPVNYEVSANGGSSWFTNASPLSLTQTNGTVPNTNIQVRLNASVNGAYSGTIMNASTGAPNAFISVNGNTVSPIITLTGALTNFSQTIGTASDVQTYVVTGTNLIENITITPPVNYEVSSDGTLWKKSASPLILTATTGTVASTTISVRLHADTEGSHTGDIVHTSSGTTTTKSVSGASSAPMVTAVSSISMERFQVDIGPNPAGSELTVHRKGKNETAFVQIFTITGVKLFSGRLEAGSQERTLDVSSFSNGIYLLEYKGQQQCMVIKFIVSH